MGYNPWDRKESDTTEATKPPPRPDWLRHHSALSFLANGSTDKNIMALHFPSGPVVQFLSFYCRRHVTPGWGTKILHTLEHRGRKKKNVMAFKITFPNW